MGEFTKELILEFKLKEIEEIYHAALEKEAGMERSTYMDTACRGDAALRKQIEVLLKANEEAADFLENPGFGMDINLDESPLSEKPGTIIGRYKLLEKIGEGGMAVVYMADQTEPIRRKVALKIIKLGMDTKSVIARFEAERQALAMMDHPNIAKVLDAGATETGRPYFVMELVTGVSITEYCDKNNLSTKERLALFIQVCNAVQHAHQKGIIHRDIKPTNVMVTRHEGRPFPKVIDFGIAKAINQKLTEKTLFTRYAHIIGTPAYMSPEQAELSDLDIDTRTDIYSLGILLYELLTGTTPFGEEELRKAGYIEMQRDIREQEPPKPSTKLSTLGEALTDIARHRRTAPDSLTKLIRGDLDWVVMKSLEKDRIRRYETASGLAGDIERHLRHEPLVARPPSTAYRVQKFMRRNKVMVTAVGMAALALVLGIVASTWLAFRERQQRQRAEVNEQIALQAQTEEARQRQAARDHLYTANMRLAKAAWDAGTYRRFERLVEDTRNQPDKGFEWHFLNRQRHAWVKRFQPQPFVGLEQPAFYPDGSRLVVVGWNGFARVYAFPSFEEILRLEGHATNKTVFGVAVSTDGHLIATSGEDTTVRIWDTHSGQLLHTLEGHTGTVYTVAFSSDGNLLSSASLDGTVRLWDVRSGATQHVFLHERATVCAFSPSGNRLATGAWDGSVKMWDLREGATLYTVRPHNDICCQIVFAADGTFIATFSSDFTVKTIDADSGALRTSMRGHKLFVIDGAFLTNDRLVSTGYDRTIRIWDVRSGLQLAQMIGHEQTIRWLDVSPDQRWIVTCSYDGTVRVWPAEGGDARTAPVPAGCIRGLAYSPDSKTLYSLDNDGSLKAWRTHDLQEVASTSVSQAGRPALALALSPDGRFLAVGSAEGVIRLFHARTLAPASTLRPSKAQDSSLDPPQDFGRFIAFSPDGGQVIAGGWAGASGHARIWDLGRGQVERELPIHPSRVWSVAWSPNGRIVATGSEDGTVEIWNAYTGESLSHFTALEKNASDPRDNGIVSLEFSPDGSLLLAACFGAKAHLWDVETGTLLHSLEGHEFYIYSAVFSPDGRRVATASYDATVRLWDAVSGQELLCLQPGFDRMTAVKFSPDGQHLAAGLAHYEGNRSTLFQWSSADE